MQRAGMPCQIILLFDSIRQGFIKTINEIYRRTNSNYVVYLAEDAFPSRNWLKCAYQSLEESGKGLLAFNDGKWFGATASFGMVRRCWIAGIYKKSLFFSGYTSHAGDTEISVIARATGHLVYNPNCTLIEVDYEKDNIGLANPEDELCFIMRYLNNFDGLAPAVELARYAEQYGVTSSYVSQASENLNKKDASSLSRESIGKRYTGNEAEVVLVNGFVHKTFKQAYFDFNKQFSRRGEPYWLQRCCSKFFPKLISFDESGEIMDYCGEPLGQFDPTLPGRRTFEPEGVNLLAFVQWLRDLEAELNRLQVKHRDINPSNILFQRETGEFTLIDLSWMIGVNEKDNRPDTLNPFAANDSEAITILSRLAIQGLISKIGRNGYRDGSSTREGWVYHPIAFEGYHANVHKSAAHDELKEVLEYCNISDLSGLRVLDVGSSVGFFSFNLAKRGCKVVGVEADPNAWAVAEALKIAHRAENVFFLNENFDEHVLEKLSGENFDLALMLNVHMWIYKQLGRERTVNVLRQLASKVEAMIFQTAHLESGGMYRVSELQNSRDISQYLKSCGFKNVKHLRDTTAHGGRRSLFLCRT
ncbi:Mg-protoporphyrin IX methyl transferase [Thiorhodovibrio litoralis]|nr:Mg-protoporphyrin IX methyl transferase [Thiorhodovibrio litoralis]